MYSGTWLCGWRWSGSIVSHLQPILPDIGLMQEPICLRPAILSGAGVRSTSSLLRPSSYYRRARDERPSASRLARLLDTHYKVEAKSKSCPVYGLAVNHARQRLDTLV